MTRRSQSCEGMREEHPRLWDTQRKGSEVGPRLKHRVCVREKERQRICMQGSQCGWRGYWRKAGTDLVELCGSGEGGLCPEHNRMTFTAIVRCSTCHNVCLSPAIYFFPHLHIFWVAGHFPELSGNLCNCIYLKMYDS